jgi:hypothetical protein
MGSTVSDLQPAEDLEPDPPPGVLRWLISCDESGTGGLPYYGFGSLWMPWQRRGDFAALVRDLRERHHHEHEFKWNKVGSVLLPFYQDLVGMFFKTNWLVFHCLVVQRAMVRKELHNNDFDLARRKQLTMLLTNKIARCRRVHRGREQTFRIWIDPIASRYHKADEVVEIVSNRVLHQPQRDGPIVDKVLTKDSKATSSIQLCDVLLGAVMDAWQRRATSQAKVDLQHRIAEHLGWKDLRSDTHQHERKFNIWFFYDSTRGPRPVTTRVVKLQ